MWKLLFITNQNYKKKTKAFAQIWRLSWASLSFFSLLSSACFWDEPPQHFDLFCHPESQACLDIFLRPPFGFGTHTLLVYGMEKGNSAEKKLVLQTELNNDGAWLDSSNIQVVWPSKEQAYLKLWGNEQDSVTYVIHLEANFTWKRIPTQDK